MSIFNLHSKLLDDYSDFFQWPREGYRVTSIQYADGQETNIIENIHET
jgi:hypothetical protein